MTSSARGRALAWIEQALEGAFDLPQLGRTVLVVAPAIGLYLHSGDVFALKAGLLAVWMLIVTERVQPSAVLLLLHAGSMAVAIGLFCATISHPWIFVPLCALCGAAAQWAHRWGKGWGSIGLYCFMPALYIGCELNATHNVSASFVQLPHWYPVAILSVAIVSFFRVRQPGDAMAAVRRYWRMTHLLPRQAVEHAAERVIVDSAAIRALAVFGAAALVEGFGIDNGEWLIWSSASVSTGAIASTHRKHQDRLWGALWGVPIGFAISPWISPSEVVYSLTVLAVCISLQTFRNYRFAFFVRCLLSVVAGVAIGGSSGIGQLRFFNVVLGGLTGVAATYLYHYVVLRLRR